MTEVPPRNLGGDDIATHGVWVQVYIHRETRRPVPIPDAVMAHLVATVAARPRVPDPV